MKQSSMLIVTSLVTLLLTTFHIADDIVRRMAPGDLTTLSAVVVWVVWLYGTLMVSERRSGLIIILIGSLLGFALPVIHMANKRGIGGVHIAESSGAFFFAWTILALAVIAPFCVILSIRGLWGLRRR